MKSRTKLAASLHDVSNELHVLQHSMTSMQALVDKPEASAAGIAELIREMHREEIATEIEVVRLPTDSRRSRTSNLSSKRFTQ